MKINTILVIIALLAYKSILFGQETVIGTIGFYNVENLFDTVDDPSINNSEYLTNGLNKWDDEKYQSKIVNISRVIADMAYGADILGLSEIENRDVLSDLVQSFNRSIYYQKNIKLYTSIHPTIGELMWH